MRANSGCLREPIVPGAIDANRQRSRSVSDSGHPGLRLPGHLEPVDLARNFSKQNMRLELRERAAHTRMHAVSPADLLFKVARYLVAVRVTPGTGVAIRRCKHEAHALARGDLEAFDLDIPRCNATRHARRRGPPQAFIEFISYKLRIDT